jgi:alanyl-tRNA synthetase
MQTAAQIRQQFLDFFREKQHTIVPSGSLMPDSPNLLFTNAGMNQFVPIFLGEKKADVSKWGGAIPGSDTRAADTQKCIRAGGKHNDLDDVGLDTYHHTFFEMLGNWSFGDYFRKEAITWSWELIVERFKFPPNRVYATIYQPDPGDPSERDQEAYDLWAEKFRSVGLDPSVHIVNGNKKDNFWMMGETGPCGPCSEIHIDLTPAGDTRGALVNKGTAECIEIWNNVFIQFNAQPSADSSTTSPKIEFVPLAQQHVDTGMGFERLTSIIQGTKEFTDFANAKISNYETDIFRPIFDELEKMSGHQYGSTLPQPNAAGQIIPTSEQEKVDVAFRVIGDHIRTLSFAIADGIQPGNTDRNYVLRRILRRAVRYGRSLGFKEPFFYKLVAVLARTMGDVFPEIRAKQKHVEEVLKREEEAFNKTLDTGIEMFTANAALLVANKETATKAKDQHFICARYAKTHRNELGEQKTFDRWIANLEQLLADLEPLRGIDARFMCDNPNYGKLDKAVNRGKKASVDGAGDSSFEQLCEALEAVGSWLGAIIEHPAIVPGEAAFKLYDTYGFPLDLTELMARERGLTVDTAGFEKHMEEQRTRARAAQKKIIIELSEVETKTPTHFLGYDHDHTGADVQEVLSVKGRTVIITNNSVCYAEMGGQVGDTGEMTHGGNSWRIANTQKSGHTWLHFLDEADAPAVGEHVTIELDRARRGAIQRHHTVTHLLHWALHEVVSHEATQKGSFVGPDKLTFDFNSAALTPAQVRDIERLVNERIVENAAVAWIEVPYADVRGRGDIMQFFGDKYGETVRVVQIGGAPRALDGYSMELCAGTHTRATGEIGLFRINSEAAIAAGVRRIEAQAGLNAYDLATSDTQRLHALATKLGTPLPELEKRIEGLLAQQKELEKALKSASQREAAGRAKDLLTKMEMIHSIPTIIANLGEADGDTLQTVADALKSHGFHGVIVLGGSANGAVALVAAVTSDHTSKAQAGKIIGAIAPLVGGKGGGKPEGARGGGKDSTQLDAALAKAKELLG